VLGGAWAVWGLGGPSRLLLGSAVYRSGRGWPWRRFRHEFLCITWGALAPLNVLFMAYSEGYAASSSRGFSPRVGRDGPVPVGASPAAPRRACAVLLGMGTSSTQPGRERIVSISLTVAHRLVLVQGVRHIAQPWRGIRRRRRRGRTRLGLALSFVFGVPGFAREKFGYSPEVPEDMFKRASEVSSDTSV